MKKIIMVILALAVGISYIPVAKAGENASFGLTVNFDIPNEPLRIWSEPAGPFEVKAGETLSFSVIAEDLDANTIYLNALDLPEGAEFDEIAPADHPAKKVVGSFYWTPKDGRYFKAPIDVRFTATSYGKDSIDVEHVELVVSITVTPHLLTLSIVVEPDMLTLGGVKLGEIVPVVDGLGESPVVRNVGNVPVGVDISYGATIQVEGQVMPGLDQGVDRFITLLAGDRLLEPGKTSMISRGIDPDEKLPLEMKYGAPTDLSDNAGTASALYELRAFLVIRDPVPFEPIDPKPLEN